MGVWLFFYFIVFLLHLQFFFSSSVLIFLLDFSLIIDAHIWGGGFLGLVIVVFIFIVGDCLNFLTSWIGVSTIWVLARVLVFLFVFMFVPLVS